jgi:hypothetical protein
VGGVSLSAAIGALRDALMQAVWAGQFALPSLLHYSP